MLDSVYMLVNNETGAIWYSPPATNAKECWERAEDWEQLNLGGASIIGWADNMRAKGWRAVKVSICK